MPAGRLPRAARERSCESARGYRTHPTFRIASGMCPSMGEMHVLLDQQNGQPRLLQLLQRLEQLIDDDRRKAERQLVDDQDVGIRHQAAGDRHHLLLAAGQRAGDLALPLGEPGKQA